MSAVINMSPDRIRSMDPEDLDEVMEIETAIYDYPWTRGIFLDCMRVGYQCHVYQQDYEIKAYSVLSLGVAEAHVLTLCVRPDSQQQGLGRMMMEHMIELARQAGAETILLEVRPSNMYAIRLYQQLGFNEVGSRPDYYPAAGGREDALIMARSLLSE
jgi:ribosomal-protein-alanine N-acetyltransferase